MSTTDAQLKFEYTTQFEYTKLNLCRLIEAIEQERGKIFLHLDDDLLD